MVGNKRIETITGYNKISINLYKPSALNKVDVTADIINGRENINPMRPTELITIDTTYTGDYANLGIDTEKNPMIVVLPNSPTFNNTVVIIDGVTYDYMNVPEGWKSK